MNGNEIDTSTYYVPAILALSLINATFVNLTSVFRWSPRR